MNHDPAAEPLDPNEEAFIRAEMERALAPYIGVAPPRLLETMRRVLEEQLRTHPVLVAMRRRLVGGGAGSEMVSGEQPKAGMVSGEQPIGPPDPKGDSGDGGEGA
jgi:hypothetical protein